MRLIVIILIWIPFLNISSAITASMKRVTQRATQTLSQTMLNQTRQLSTTKANRFVQLPSITQMWQKNIPTVQTPENNPELQINPTIQTRQIASELPVNPLTLYSQILQWKQMQSPKMQEKVQNKLAQLTKLYKKFNAEPNKENAYELIKDCINFQQPIKHRTIKTTMLDEQEIMHGTHKMMATNFYHEFNAWKQQQPADTLKLLDPFIQEYEKAYTTSIQHSIFAHGLDNLQRFLNLIVHPDQSPVHTMSMIQNIEQAHNELLKIVGMLSKDQRKRIEPLLQKYQQNYHHDLQDPNDWVKNVISKQITIAHIIQQEIPISQPTVAHYNTKLQSLANNVEYPSDLPTLDHFKNFIKTTEKLKPELLALEHIAHTHAPGDHLIPLASHSNTIGVVGAHYGNTMHVEVGQEFHDSTPSYQYHTLTHEARHHFQTQAGVFKYEELAQKFYPPQVLAQAAQHADNMTWELTSNQKIWKAYEYDADHFATSNITCPTCLKVIQTQRKTSKSPEGYFNKADIEPFIKAAQHNPCCPAHTMTPGDQAHNKVVAKLNRGLTLYRHIPMSLRNNARVRKFLRQRISTLDKQSGTLLQHIPQYHQNLIRTVAQNKEQEARVAATTIKEIDIRKTMEQTERDIQAGKYKMLEAPKPIVEYPK